jgi:hypothetical protein
MNARRSKVKLRNVLALGIVSLLFSATLTASKEPAGQTIDSGSFGVYVNGQRVADETFTITQSSSGSTISSQLHEAGGGDKATQTSQLQLTAAGELIRYEWHELSPSKSELELIPNDQFLTERVTANPGEKPAEQPFLLPSSTVVLDNNFFIHRELLAWRYLAQNCKSENGQPLQCTAGPTSFGAIVPQDRLSMRVSLEPVGREKVQVKGTERELPRFTLKFEGGEWALWLDDHDRFKIVKISIPSEKTEIVRD